MAFVKHNIVTQGISGMVGRMLVFKNWKGRTIVAARPKKPSTQTVRQKETRAKFREATFWAKAQMLDPEQKAYYKQKADELDLPNAYTAAITDYMRKPKIESVEVIEKADVIEVQTEVVKKGFEAEVVEVEVKDVNGAVVASGKAKKTSKLHTWSFTPDGKWKAGLVMAVRVRDKAGNEVERKLSKSLELLES